MLPLLIASTLWIIPLTTLLVSDRFGAHDYSRVVELLAVTACALVWAWRLRGRDVRFCSTGWIVLALAGCVGVSTAMAHHPWIALREVTLAVGLVAFALAVREALTEARLRSLLAALAVTAFGYGLVIYVPMTLAATSGAVIYTFDLVVGFDNPRFLNHCQSVAIPLLVLAATWTPVRPLLRWIALSAATMTCGILGLCSARASVLAVLAAAFVPMILLRRSAFRFSFTVLGVLAVGGLGMTYVSWDWPRTLDEFTSVESLMRLNYRDFLIRRALAVWWASPWFGVGPMHFADTFNVIAAHPHNVYLQLLCEYGLFAAALVLVLAWRGGKALIRAASFPDASGHASNELRAAVIGMLAAVLTDALFSGSFVMPLSQLWCALAFGIAGWFQRSVSDGISAPVDSIGHVGRFISAARWLLCIAMLVLSANGIRELVTLPVPALLTSEQPEVPRGMAFRNPRFWEHGWF